MSTLTIKTNNRPRDLFAYYELTPKEAKDFDYIEGEDQYTPRLFRYQGNVYDTCEFMRCGEMAEAFNTVGNQTKAKWDGYQSDTYFSGVLVRYVEDFERVIVAAYYS